MVLHQWKLGQQSLLVKTQFLLTQPFFGIVQAGFIYRTRLHLGECATYKVARYNEQQLRP